MARIPLIYILRCSASCQLAPLSGRGASMHCAPSGCSANCQFAFLLNGATSIHCAPLPQELCLRSATLLSRHRSGRLSGGSLLLLGGQLQGYVFETQADSSQFVQIEAL